MAKRPDLQPSDSAAGFPLNHVLMGVSDAIWVVDRELRFRYINERGQWFHRLVSDSGLWPDRYRRAFLGERLCFLEQHNEGEDRHHFEVCMEAVERGGDAGDSDVVVIARPVTQRRQTLLDASIGGTVILDDDTGILFANNGFEDLVLASKSDLESKRTLLEFVHPDDQEVLLAIISDSHARGGEGRFERQLRIIDTRQRVRQVIVVCGTSSDTHHTVVSMLDITAQMEAQNRLRQQADQLRALHGSAAELNALIREPVLLYRRSLELLREAVAYDTASVQLLEGDTLQIVACSGFSPADHVVGLEFTRDLRLPNWHVVLERRTLAADDVRESYPHFQGQSATFQSGNIRSWLGVPLVARGEIVGMIALDRNSVSPFSLDEQRLVSTTANHVAVAVHNATLYALQQKYEADLRAAGGQKELLLRELHHRVKNNMQLVSSLLSLRLSGMTDPGIGDVLEEMKIRIESLGAIHDELYRSERVDRVDLGGYTRRIVDLVTSSFGNRAGVRIEVETGEVAASVETSVPFGLILSELLLNALKHAFPGNRDGTIEVHLRTDNKTSILQVIDDGVGLPVEMQAGRSGSLGMQLIQSLGQQISGTVAVDGTRGTTWSLVFPAFIPEESSPR